MRAQDHLLSMQLLSVRIAFFLLHHDSQILLTNIVLSIENLNILCKTFCLLILCLVEELVEGWGPGQGRQAAAHHQEGHHGAHRGVEHLGVAAADCPEDGAEETHGHHEQGEHALQHRDQHHLRKRTPRDKKCKVIIKFRNKERSLFIVYFLIIHDLNNRVAALDSHDKVRS